jgi:hypothetical protein
MTASLAINREAREAHEESATESGSIAPSWTCIHASPAAGATRGEPKKASLWFWGSIFARIARFAVDLK